MTHPVPDTASPRRPPRRRLPPAVLALGVTSLFTDIGSEMAFPLLPVFLAGLGAAPAFLGLVEGLAEATAAFLKLGSGLWADRVTKRKPLVLAGYGLAAAVRPLIALATAPWHVLAVRVADRVGKGVRTAPRDVILANAAAPGEEGRAFGFHRAMDHAGAMIGPLVATALLALGLELRTVFALALIPGVASVVALLVLKEPTSPAPAPEAAVVGPRPPLSGALKRYLLALFVFSLGNSTDAFLLLQARDLGTPVALLPVLWSLLHVVKVVSTWLGGAWADRVPKRRLVLLGWVVYALVYLGLGLAASAWQAWLLFLLYGTYYGLTEPAEKALVKQLAPVDQRGRAFGLYHFVLGVTAVPAGLMTGWLWQAASPLVALATGALLAAVAGMMLAVRREACEPR